MTEVETKSLQSSIGNSLVVGFMASQLFLVNPIIPLSGDDRGRIMPFIDYSMSPSTHGQHGDLFAAARLADFSELASSALEMFYADLMAKQERLGTEFEQVLYQNLWTLYAR